MQNISLLDLPEFSLEKLVIEEEEQDLEEFSNLLDEYLENSKNINTKTKEKYQKVIDEYVEFKKKYNRNEDDEKTISAFFSFKIRNNPKSLWGIHSGLNYYLLDKNKSMKDYPIVVKWIKENSQKHIVKVSNVITNDQFETLMKMDHGSSRELLLQKVAFIIGCFGLLRCSEIKNLKIRDLNASKRQNVVLGFNVSVVKSKTDKLGNGFTFWIPNEDNGSYNPAEIISDYIKTVESDLKLSFSELQTSEFLFACNWSKKKEQKEQKFQLGNVGKNKLAKIPAEVAKLLGLNSNKKFTGHCFRRSGASMYAENGLSTENLKRVFKKKKN
jgi:integrase